MTSRVAVVRTAADTVLADVARAARLAGMREALQPVTTILKDNISWHYPFLSANTTPWQLEGVIRTLHETGFHDLVAVHNDTVVTDPFLGGRLNRLDDVYAAYAVPERYNFRSSDMKWIEYQPKSEMLALGRIFPDGIHIPDFFIGKNVVHLPTVKCHIYTTTTGAMKNAFGGLLNTQRHYAHAWIHEALVDLLAIQQEIHPGIFAVMDGTVAGNGAGPRTMQPVEKNVFLASADQVAIDAVAASMMGFDPMSIPYIRLAHDRGLGVGELSQIEIVGDVDVADERWGFHVGRNLASTVGASIWHGPLRALQKPLFHTPLVHAFIQASSVYHDRLWWPWRGRAVQAALRGQSQWGRLFDTYCVSEPAALVASSPNPNE